MTVFLKPVKWVHYGVMQRMGYHAIDSTGHVVAVAPTKKELIKVLGPGYRLLTGTVDETG